MESIFRGQPAIAKQLPKDAATFDKINKIFK